MIKKNILRILVLNICIFLVIVTIPTTTLNGNFSKHSFLCNLNKNIIYVGGNGPNNYSTIQEAINAAFDGSIIYVFNGMYLENIIIDKKVQLTGEDKSSTIIDGNGIGDVITILVDNVSINGFTITNSGYHDLDAGIQIESKNSLINNVNITETHRSIFLAPGSKKSTIKENILINNYHGVYLYSGSSNNTILNNVISDNNRSGVYTYGSKGDIIEDNKLFRNGNGIVITYGQENSIAENIISNNIFCGILLLDTCGNNLIENNSVSGHRNLSGIAIVDTCSNNIISNNSVYDNYEGIYIESSFDNIINDNIIELSLTYGIYSVESFENIIEFNQIELNNMDGLYLLTNNYNNTIRYNTFNINKNANYRITPDCNNNIFYLNNFYNNTSNEYDKGINIWDNNGKGNYWSDYKYRYPNAQKLWLKGVWNTPYEINGGNNQDEFPLIKPFSKSISKTCINWITIRFFENLTNLFRILKNMY